MIRFVAATMLAIEIAIHVDLAPDHLHEIPYIGAGFVLSSVLLAIALVGVVMDAPAGWLLGGATCVGMAGLFILSRTTGLPGFHEAWTSDNNLGIYALAFEAGYLALLPVALTPQRLDRFALPGATRREIARYPESVDRS